MAPNVAPIAIDQRNSRDRQGGAHDTHARRRGGGNDSCDMVLPSPMIGSIRGMRGEGEQSEGSLAFRVANQAKRGQVEKYGRFVEDWAMTRRAGCFSLRNNFRLKGGSHEIEWPLLSSRARQPPCFHVASAVRRKIRCSIGRPNAPAPLLSCGF